MKEICPYCGNMVEENESFLIKLDATDYHCSNCNKDFIRYWTETDIQFKERYKGIK